MGDGDTIAKLRVSERDQRGMSLPSLLLITALQLIYAIPLAVKPGWERVHWQSVFRQEIREIRRAANQEVFKEHCWLSKQYVSGPTQPTDRHHFPF